MDIKERIAEIESDDKNDAHILHELLELAMFITGKGEVSEDYTKSIEFPVGDITIFSDPYYGSVQIEDETDLDNETIKKLIKDIKRRLLQFDKKIRSTRKKIAADIFDKPLKGVMEDESED